jgi:hypothetical protein
MKFREDMLLKVMESAGIDASHRDDFVTFAADYDHDDNGYLKKSELEDAASAWNARDGASDAGEEDAEADEASNSEGQEELEGEPDAPTDGADAAEEKACMICSTANAHDAAVCTACGYTFES